MKKFVIFIFIGALGIINLPAQISFNAAMGFAGGSITSPGVVLEFEMEQKYNGNFSSPSRSDISFLTTFDYYALFADVHKGFREYFSSGLFLEQYAGIGISGKRYTNGEFWTIDEYSKIVSYDGQTIWGVIPSVTGGAGYNFSSNIGRKDMIWIRSKIYWDLDTTNLHLPFFMVQVGFTHGFKTIER